MNKIKLIVVFVLEFILAIGIGNSYKLNAIDVTYDKKATALEGNTVSGAIDELGVLATTSMSELKTKMDSMDTKIDAIYENLINGADSSLEIVTSSISGKDATVTWTMPKDYEKLVIILFSAWPTTPTCTLGTLQKYYSIYGNSNALIWIYTAVDVKAGKTFTTYADQQLGVIILGTTI